MRKVSRVLLLILTLLSLLVTGLFAAMLLFIYNQVTTGREIAANGRTAQVEDVRVGYEEHVHRWKGGGTSLEYEFIGVSVRFRTEDGQEITTLLEGAEQEMPIGAPDLTTEQLAPRKGWTEPLPGSEYRLPLEVMYLPGNPKKAMEKQEALGSASARFGTFRWFYIIGGGALALAVLSFSGWRAVRSRT